MSLFQPLDKDLIKPVKKETGLGDKVEKIAQPIAKTIDKVFKTNVQECSSCKKRKAWLNEKFPAKTD